jgi:hypothetical protein
LLGSAKLVFLQIGREEVSARLCLTCLFLQFSLRRPHLVIVCPENFCGTSWCVYELKKRSEKNNGKEKWKK